MATTFLPLTGKYAAWSHPAERRLATRMLGRTGREVTTFGLAGGNKVQWDLPGDEAVQIVVKAVRAGMTYIETANNYFLSQEKMGKAFEVLNLKPGLPGYDHSLRGACSSPPRPLCGPPWRATGPSPSDDRRAAASSCWTTSSGRSLSSSATARDTSRRARIWT